MTDRNCKQSIDNNLSILWNFDPQSGSRTDFEVKAVKPYTKASKEKTLYGIAKLTLKGKKEVTLNDITVFPPYRRKGVGSKMLSFIANFLTDQATDVTVNCTFGGIDNQDIATKFLLKNGFSFEKSDFKLILKKENFHYSTTKGLEAIKKDEYEDFDQFS